METSEYNGNESDSDGSESSESSQGSFKNEKDS